MRAACSRRSSGVSPTATSREAVLGVLQGPDIRACHRRSAHRTRTPNARGLTPLGLPSLDEYQWAGHRGSFVESGEGRPRCLATDGLFELVALAVVGPRDRLERPAP